MSGFTPAERAHVNAIALRALTNPPTEVSNLETLRAALRDIALGAEMMQGVGSPSSAMNRYAAEVERVATTALARVRP